MKIAEAEALAVVLKALADPVRLQLINIIATSGEACACDLPEAVGKSQPTVSHHLKQLVEVGILDREQRGCLLYTSPSPRDQRGSRMPSSA